MSESSKLLTTVTDQQLLEEVKNRIVQNSIKVVKKSGNAGYESVTYVSLGTLLENGELHLLPIATV